MSGKKSSSLAVALLVVLAFPLRAQFSFNPKPAPETRWFAVTEIGAVPTLNRVEVSSREQLLNWELGLMKNLAPRNSLGATIFISHSKDAEVYDARPMRSIERRRSPRHSP
jgi:hypothetical protein